MPIGLAAPAVSPSFLALHPNGRTLYAVNESRRYSGLTNSGSVSAFSIDAASGKLTLLNLVASGGADPAHLTTDRTGRWLFVANYSGGSVAVFPIRQDGGLEEASQVVQFTGSTKADPVRQEAPHAHSVDISPDNRTLYVSDLGNDRIVLFDFDAASGVLRQRSQTMLTAGTGPRHLAFSRDRRYVYSLGELTATVTTFTAAMDQIQTISTLPADYAGPNSAAEIAVDPMGRFLYASNRGHNSIAIFRIDAEQGRLTPAGIVLVGGKTPRFFAIDPAGTHLLVANQDSQELVIFKIDAETGGLTRTGSLEVFEPVSVVFVRK